MKNLQNRFAFTLAEVLITLAIIGVVAAMTIPTLIAKIQNKELETAFKNNYSMLQNAYKQAYNDNGGIAPKLSDKNAVDAFFSNFKIASATKPSGYYVMTFDKTSTAENEWYVLFPFQNFSAFESYILADGSMIGIYSYNQSAAAANVVVDTNGVKGPNRLGYDVFIYTNTNNHNSGDVLTPAGATWLNPPEYDVPTRCMPLDKGGLGDGVFCTYYALLDKCPWDDTKTYWESLP